MHTGRDQQLVEEAVDELTDVVGIVDEGLQAVDPAVDRRPHVAHEDAEHAGNRDGEEEHPARAVIGAYDLRELDVAEPVEQPAIQAAQDDADEYAHVHYLDAEHHALAGAVQAARSIGQHVVAGEPGVVGVQEHQEGGGRDDRRITLLFVGERTGQTDAEQQAEISDHT